MTIHGSKSELRWLRYPENRTKRVSTHPEAITFYPTVRFSISLFFWKLDIQIFPKTLKSVQSESRKTFKYMSEAGLGKSWLCWCHQGGRRPYKVRRKPKGQFPNINTPKPLILQPKKIKIKIKIGSLWANSLSSLPNTPKHIQTHRKHIQTSSNTFDL